MLLSLHFKISFMYEIHCNKEAAVRSRTLCTATNKGYLTSLKKQQTRTFHRLVKGSGLNALALLTKKELGKKPDFLYFSCYHKKIPHFLNSVFKIVFIVYWAVSKIIFKTA